MRVCVEAGMDGFTDDPRVERRLYVFRHSCRPSVAAAAAALGGPGTRDRDGEEHDDEDIIDYEDEDEAGGPGDDDDHHRRKHPPRPQQQQQHHRHAHDHDRRTPADTHATSLAINAATLATIGSESGAHIGSPVPQYSHAAPAPLPPVVIAFTGGTDGDTSGAAKAEGNYYSGHHARSPTVDGSSTGHVEGAAAAAAADEAPNASATATAEFPEVRTLVEETLFESSLSLVVPLKMLPFIIRKRQEILLQAQRDHQQFYKSITGTLLTSSSNKTATAAAAVASAAAAEVGGGGSGRKSSHMSRASRPSGATTTTTTSSSVMSRNGHNAAAASGAAAGADVPLLDPTVEGTIAGKVVGQRGISRKALRCHSMT